jgi:hypothetical protein
LTPTSTGITHNTNGQITGPQTIIISDTSMGYLTAIFVVQTPTLIPRWGKPDPFSHLYTSEIWKIESDWKVEREYEKQMLKDGQQNLSGLIAEYKKTGDKQLLEDIEDQKEQNKRQRQHIKEYQESMKRIWEELERRRIKEKSGKDWTPYIPPEEERPEFPPLPPGAA